jgi:hypothetical protein
MKYRIVETIKGFYPQEKKNLLLKWKYLDKSNPSYTLGVADAINTLSLVETYDKALEVIERRKQYIKDKNFRKIHNL